MITNTPYGRLLGARQIQDDKGRTLVTLNAVEPLAGRPEFLHGGVIAGMLEMACITAVQDALGNPDLRIKPINVAVDYLRGGLMLETFAHAEIIRMGRRFVNASASCWQQDEAKPIATARMHFQIG